MSPETKLTAQETKEAVLWVAKEMLRTNLVEGTAGNLGARLPDGNAVLTPSSVDYTEMTLDDLLAEADVVSMHAMITPETQGMIGAEQFARMKDDAIYVNTARAMLHDTDALVGALESGTLGGAGLDHFEGEHLPTDHPLQSMPNVVLTPHIGGATYDTEANHSKLIADGLEQLLGGGKPDNLVNPEVLS